MYADPDDAISLLVSWDAPAGSNGAEIASYIVEFAPASSGWSKPYVNVTVTVEDAARTAATASVGDSGYAAAVTLSEADVTCGEAWAVRVRSVNEMGEGPPDWYSAVVSGL